MNSKRKISMIASIAIIIMLAAGCISSEYEENVDEENGLAGMANPASVYAERMGYESEMRENENGQYSVVMFPDGSECEEWTFFRGECAKEWQKDHLVDLISVNMIRDWAQDLTISGINVDTIKNASNEGYYLTEKESKTDALLVYDSTDSLCGEVIVFLNDSWENELISILSQTN